MAAGGRDEADNSRRSSGHRAPESGFRRAKSQGRKKHYHVTATPEEHAEITRRATTRRVTIPYLLVASALADQDGQNGEKRASNEQLLGVYREVVRVLRMLSASSNNLNQIARVANSTGDIQPGIGPAIDRINGLSGRIHDLLDSVEGLGR